MHTQLAQFGLGHGVKEHVHIHNLLKNVSGIEWHKQAPWNGCRVPTAPTPSNTSGRSVYSPSLYTYAYTLHLLLLRASKAREVNW